MDLSIKLYINNIIAVIAVIIVSVITLKPNQYFLLLNRKATSNKVVIFLLRRFSPKYPKIILGNNLPEKIL